MRRGGHTPTPQVVPGPSACGGARVGWATAHRPRHGGQTPTLRVVPGPSAPGGARVGWATAHRARRGGQTPTLRAVPAPPRHHRTRPSPCRVGNRPPPTDRSSASSLPKTTALSLTSRCLGEGHRLRHAMRDPHSGRDAKALRPAPAPPSAGASRPPGRALAYRSNRWDCYRGQPLRTGGGNACVSCSRPAHGELCALVGKRPPSGAHHAHPTSRSPVSPPAAPRPVRRGVASG